MKRWLEQIEYIKASVKKFPTSYTPVRELKEEDFQIILSESSKSVETKDGSNEETFHNDSNDSVERNSYGAVLAHADDRG